MSTAATLDAADFGRPGTAATAAADVSKVGLNGWPVAASSSSSSPPPAAMASSSSVAKVAGAGRSITGTTEVRTVPSPLFPTIASALEQPSMVALDSISSPSRCAVPNLVVRILSGVYYEELVISHPVVLVGADEALPTIHGTGVDGVRVATGAGGGLCCALRKLRFVAEPQGRALTVDNCSPLVESCEVLGPGGDPVRGAPPGLLVKGADAQPVFRGCRISGHAAAGLSFVHSASGVVVGCDISSCACGVWLDGKANPLLWRNTIAGHRGAGVVIRADAQGTVMGNTVLRNGAGGVLVESTRSSLAKILQNRVWSNIGWDLRQSPSAAGLSAGELGVMLLNNIVGQQGSDTSAAPGIQLSAAWPKRSVDRSSDLLAAVRQAPRNRLVLLEIVGRLVLEEPLILDRPIVLMGSNSRQGSTSPELIGPAGGSAVIIVAPGGEASAICQLLVTLPAPAGGTTTMTRPGACCIEISAGSPTILDCELDVAASRTKAGASKASRAEVVAPVPTHALRVTGAETAPLLAGCALKGAAGAGVLVDSGAAAWFLQCEISGNQQGGLFLGEGAKLRLEACEVSRNGHFAVVVGPGAMSAYVGRSSFASNTTGAIWHCGGRQAWDTSAPATTPPVQHPLWLDECSVSGAPARKSMASPPIVLGAGASIVLWDTLFAQQMSGKRPMARLEGSSRCIVAGDGSEQQQQGGGGGGMSGWGRAMPDASSQTSSMAVVGTGTTVWLDISGAAPPQPPPPTKRPEVEFPPRPLRPSSASSSAAGLGFAGGGRGGSGGRAGGRQQGATDGATDQAGGAGKGSQSPRFTEGEAAFPNQGIGGDDDVTGLPPLGSGGAGEAGLGAEGDPDGIADGGDQAAADRSSELQLWVREYMQSKGEVEIPDTEQNRRSLFSLLGMLVVQHRCQDALDVVGLSGPLRNGDFVYLRGHTGRWFSNKNGTIVCNQADRPGALQFVVESKSSAIKADSKVAFRLVEPPDPNAAGGTVRKMGVNANNEVKAVQRREGSKDAETQFVVVASRAGVVNSGTAVCLKSVSATKLMEVDGDAVRTRSSEMGTHQRISIEKLPAESEVPPACEEMDFATDEKAWLYRRGVEFSLLDKQGLAKFLAGHKPSCKEMLKAYTKLWEAEWRLQWKELLRPLDDDRGEDSGGSPGSRQSQSRADDQSVDTDRTEAAAAASASAATGDGVPAGATATSSSPAATASSTGTAAAGPGPGGSRQRTSSRSRMSKRDRIFTMFSGPNSEDKNNGNLFISALRSYFATALRMSQLEADPVQRVIEAFAEALVADAAFLECFSSSMLPEAERKTYRTPEEVLFGLTYTTLMLNTDMHNKQVAQKMWDTKKFVGAGKDCGVSGGLMMQIFKNVQKEEL